MTLPIVTQYPRCDRAKCCPSYYSGRTDTLLEYAYEAAYEDDDRADMLHDDRAIGNKWPELVWPQTLVDLEMVQECLLISVVVWIALLHPEQLLPWSRALSTAASAFTAVSSLPSFTGASRCCCHCVTACERASRPRRRTGQWFGVRILRVKMSTFVVLYARSFSSCRRSVPRCYDTA